MIEMDHGLRIVVLLYLMAKKRLITLAYHLSSLVELAVMATKGCFMDEADQHPSLQVILAQKVQDILSMLN